MPFSHNVCVPVCCLGVLRHSMMLSLWWDCLSSSLTSAASPLSPRTRLSICRNYTWNIVASLKEIYTNTKMSWKYSLQAKKTHTHAERTKIPSGWKQNNMTKCQELKHTQTHTPDRVPQVDGRVSLICDAAPLLLACSSVCDTTEAPQSFAYPTCSCSGRHHTAEIQLDK